MPSYVSIPQNLTKRNGPVFFFRYYRHELIYLWKDALPVRITKIKNSKQMFMIKVDNVSQALVLAALFMREVHDVSDYLLYDNTECMLYVDYGQIADFCESSKQQCMNIIDRCLKKGNYESTNKDRWDQELFSGSNDTVSLF